MIPLKIATAVRVALARFRTATLTLSLATVIGLLVYAVRLYCERVVWHIPESAIFFSALHSEWALVFLYAILCTLVAPFALLGVVAYILVDAGRRVYWIALGAALVIGLAVAYAPQSVWNRLWVQ